MISFPKANQINLSFWLITISLIGTGILPNAFQEGMFMDGAVYAAVAKNMALGTGSFWAPPCLDAWNPVFYEHPPLGFFLQSLLFKIFPDWNQTENLYSFILAIGTATILALIWRKIQSDTPSKRNAWFPVLLFFSISICMWSFSNNMLETTSMFFTLASIYVLLKFSKYTLLSCVLSAFLIFAALLTKGMIALFPLSFFLVENLAFRKTRWVRCFLLTALHTFSVGVLIMCLYLYAPARIFFETYFDHQLVKSLTQAVDPNSGHFYILGRIPMELIPPILLCIIVFIFSRISVSKVLQSASARWILFFSLLGCAASLPVMISPKQSGYYILPSLPFFTLALAILTKDALEIVLNKMIASRIAHKIVFISAIFSILISFTLIFVISSQNGKDHRLLSDIDKIGVHIGKGQTVGVCNDIIVRYSFKAYCSRFYQIGFDINSPHHSFFLVLKDQCELPVAYKWEKIDLQLEGMELFRRIEAIK